MAQRVSTPRLQLMLSRYAVVQGMQVAQTAGCNRLHDIKQRLARWLLMTQDRVDSELLPVTHDFLATMLGTDRPSVSLAAGILQKKKLIEYTRGAVNIVNRKKLEDATCECYGITQQYNGELGLEISRYREAVALVKRRGTDSPERRVWHARNMILSARKSA